MPSNLDWPLALILALVGVPILGAIFYMFGESVWEDPAHFVRMMALLVVWIVLSELAKWLYRKFRRKPAQAD